MDMQKILADAQAKADVNGDGKLTVDDLASLASTHGIDSSVIDTLKGKIDVNGDGKLDIEDLKSASASLDTAQAGGFFENIKDKIFGKK